ncbi:hypothetical protein ACQPZF_35605 [Actinosynnema sp. CS-041913]|uniref:hypothetical protein n=1 Tax=Actinosynnema sp. CS-041913 TaxID=3239917 RepID=UPI003D8D1AED
MTAPVRSRIAQALKWVAVAVIAVEVLLVATGALDLGQAVVIAVGLEVLCGVLAIGLAVTARLYYRRLRRAGTGRWDAFLQAAGTVLPRPVVTLLRHELGGLMSIVLLVRGRKDVQAEATVIRCGSAQKTFLIVMMVLGPLEIFLVDLIVPWTWLRILLLVLGVYSVIWLFGFYAGLHTRPHYVGDDLVLRVGHLAAISVDVDSIRAVRRETHDKYSGTKYKGLVSVQDDFVAMQGMSGTTVTVVLEPGTPVRIQGRGTVHAGEVRFDADDLAAAVETIKERIGSSGDRSRDV